MAVSRLRRWWGSRRLLPFAAGLTLLAMTGGAGNGIGIAVTPGPLRDATVAVTSAHAIPGAPVTDPDTGVRSVRPHGSTAPAVSNGDVTPSGVLADQFSVRTSSRSTTAHRDTRPLTGVALTPRGPRAPPAPLV